MRAAELALAVSKQLLLSGSDPIDAVAALRIALRHAEEALQKARVSFAQVERLEREYWGEVEGSEPAGKPS